MYTYKTFVDSPTRQFTSVYNLPICNRNRRVSYLNPTFVRVYSREIFSMMLCVCMFASIRFCTQSRSVVIFTFFGALPAGTSPRGVRLFPGVRAATRAAVFIARECTLTITTLRKTSENPTRLGIFYLKHNAQGISSDFMRSPSSPHEKSTFFWRFTR